MAPCQHPIQMPEPVPRQESSVMNPLYHGPSQDRPLSQIYPEALLSLPIMPNFFSVWISPENTSRNTCTQIYVLERVAKPEKEQDCAPMSLSVFGDVRAMSPFCSLDFRKPAGQTKGRTIFSHLSLLKKDKRMLPEYCGLWVKSTSQHPCRESAFFL